MYVGNYINGNKDGLWVEWHENGARKYNGHYKNGEKEGEWLERDIHDKVIINIVFKNGNKWEGRFGEKFYIEGVESIGVQNNYPNGRIKEEGVIVNGKKIGRWTFWYDTGERKSTGLYKNGEEHGRWYYWYKSGQKEKEGIYSNGIKQGEWLGFYYTGNKFFKRTFKDGKKHGLWAWWFENGHKKYIGGYKEDKKDGKWQEWDLDGEIQVDGIYKNGDKWDGAFNSLIYSNGVKAILSQDYYDGGSSIKEEGLILGENKIGEWTYWHENGEKKAEGNISNNQKNGICRIFFDNSRFC